VTDDARQIRKAAVIGAGTMGSGIAAHVANAGVPVVLLDVVPDGAADRSALARGAVERALAARPAPFMTPRAARLVTPGNLEDDLGLLADCDWIVEAVLEDADVKHAVYARIDEHRKPGSIVSSNTSTIPLHELAEGAPPTLAADLLITHFFNPPRYLRLLEVVAGPGTRGDAVAAVSGFADRALGKAVVPCNDTPGFIANRLGALWMDCALGEAVARGLAVEAADAVISRAFGCPRTGIFGLLDLVGLDLVLLVQRSFDARLAPDDPARALRRPDGLLERMVADGRTGRKGAGGFYRLDRADGGRARLALDLATDTYRPQETPRLVAIEAARRGGLRALVEAGDAHADYAWAVVSTTLSYAAHLVPEVSDSPALVDRALETGYGWEAGPFALADALGTAYLAERLQAEGRPVPAFLARAAGAGGFYAGHEELTAGGERRRLARPPGVVLLRDVKQDRAPLARNGSAALWDVGDDVACLEFTSRMNAIDPATIGLLVEAIGRCAAGAHRALVVHNEAERFSVGANLGGVLLYANTAQWTALEAAVRGGQDAYQALKRAPFPVVGAPSGMALGGGCEILLHADAIVAHAESYVGLPEVGVGIVPGWGGCKELLLRMAARRPHGPMAPTQAAFEVIGLAKVSGSAAEARELGFLRETDAIVPNRERVLAEAKARALELADGYAPPEPAELVLPGPSGAAALELGVRNLALTGQALPHDQVVSRHLARVLSGGDCDPTVPVSEQHVLDLEREALLALARTEGTLRRMEHMLATGRPLRN
jgi:3-hydroxyacyl-CoA dehydrogenase